MVTEVAVALITGAVSIGGLLIQSIVDVFKNKHKKPDENKDENLKSMQTELNRLFNEQDRVFNRLSLMVARYVVSGKEDEDEKDRIRQSIDECETMHSTYKDYDSKYTAKLKSKQND